MPFAFALLFALGQLALDGGPDVAAPPEVPPPSATVLTLEEALSACDDHQPQLVQAQANTRAAQARVEEARGAWLPQLTAAAGLVYTGPFGENGGGGGAAVLGAGGAAGGGASGSSAVFAGGGGRTSISLTAYQLVYDFNQTLDKIASNQAAVAGYRLTQDETVVTTHLTVRSAYYNARALKALQQMASETLTNEQKHLRQTEGQIRVGTQPEIALATEKATYSNDVYQLLLAIGNYGIGRSQLNQAMGVEGSTDFDVQPIDAPEVRGEAGGLDSLISQALKARPAWLSIQKQIDAQALFVSSYRGNLWPNLFVQGGMQAFGTRPEAFNGDLYGELELTWPFFNWTNINAVAEQEADLVLLRGQAAQLRQQIRLDLDTSRIQVLTYKASVAAAEATAANAKEQLRLAEGRYKSGIGSVIELGDSQVAATNAAVQVVQAQFNLNTARATLLAKLGQK